MRRILLFIISLFLGMMLISCQSKADLPTDYDEDTFGYIDLQKDNIKIMQLTDLHLTYGIDALDRKTFVLLDALVAAEQPDLIVLTGDLFMSIFAKSLLKKFIAKIESYEIPWAYTFGNHEREYHSMETLINILLTSETKYLYFHPGPFYNDNHLHGYSNYKLKITNGETPLVNIYLLDSKAKRIDKERNVDSPYDYFSEEQVSWYRENLEQDDVKSMAFMHIPLVQYLEYNNEDLGRQAKEGIWPQGRDTGFFEANTNNGNKTMAIFAGHDHMNNHIFLLDGVMLAYGVSSGYNAYGPFESKGARIITYQAGADMVETYMVFEGDVL